MFRFIGCGVAALMLMTATASAEENSEQVNKVQVVGKTLNQLLNDGYQIRTATMQDFVLVKDDKWVFCRLDVSDGFVGDVQYGRVKPGAIVKSPSVCLALNKKIE
jgi:hypothetical protein